VLLVYLACTSACTQEAANPPPLSLGGLTMGTTYSIKINEPDLQIATEKINSDMIDILTDVNNKMSTYLNDSELSLINQNSSHEWIPLSDDLHFVINEAISVSMLTEGNFDITVGPLVNLWGFGPSTQTQHIPAASDISDALSRTGFQNINLRSALTAIQKVKSNIYIDLSGIAKGYAVDKLAEYLERQNINNYMVEIGGEIRAKGINEAHFSWRIGIETPVTEQRSVQRIIKLENIAMATSGDYRNYFEQDGNRYSHTIDPHTGRPITHDLVSVTVLHKSATRADALATGFLVMGKESGFSLALQEDLPVLFIERTEDGFTESYTDAFANYLLDQ
jgi:thiamine biosynthesis lipoprotein